MEETDICTFTFQFFVLNLASSFHFFPRAIVFPSPGCFLLALSTPVTSSFESNPISAWRPVHSSAKSLRNLGLATLKQHCKHRKLRHTCGAQTTASQDSTLLLWFSFIITIYNTAAQLLWQLDGLWVTKSADIAWASGPTFVFLFFPFFFFL